MQRIEGLDGLRAVAALFVFAFHARVPGFTGGWIGVDVFFVLSGFLITLKLAEEADRRNSIAVLTFYWRRTLRLAPALVPLLIVVFAARPDLWKTEVIPAALYVSNWTRAFSNFPRILGHTWSLAIEEQFYLLWPLALLMLLRVRRETALVIVVGLTLASGAWRGFLFATGASVPRLYNGFDTHADGLLLGCALALAGKAEWRRLALAWPLAVVSLILAAALLPWRHPLVYAGGLWFIALAATILIAAIASGHAVGLVRLLQLAPLAWLGVISYGFYLWHYPVLMLLRGHGGGPPGPALVVGAFAITLAAAVASWHLVETPAARLRPRAMQRAD